VVAPLLYLALLFAAELVLLSVWLDGAALSSHAFLIAAIRDAGPRILRSLIAFSVVFFGFAFLKQRLKVSKPAPFPRWIFLAMHAAGMAAFAGLSLTLYAGGPSAAQSNGIAALWLALGLASGCIAALAFLPAPSWWALARSAGSIWIYALLAVPAAFTGEWIRNLWLPLTGLTLRLVVALLSLFTTATVVPDVAPIVRTPHFAVQIAPECSGFEGIALMLAFGAAWLCLFRKECRFPQAFLLLPAGVTFIYLLNAVRIAALILVGDAGAPEIASGGFHSQAGWIAFALASLAFNFAASRSSWITVQSVGSGSAPPVANAPAPIAARAAPRAVNSDPTAAYLGPFLAVLTAGMLATAVSANFEWLYGLRFFAAVAALYACRASYRKMDWHFGWLGPLSGAGVFVLWVAFDRAIGAAPIAALPAPLAHATPLLRVTWITFRAIAASITVPIAEELAFRGFLMRRFVAADFESVAWRKVTWIAVAVSSVLFGLMHGGRWIPGIIAGAIFAGVAIRRRRIGEAVVAHAVANVMIAVYVLAFGHWELW
jgi:exosortase E/protease (VPEID-CTERM system)